MDRARLGVVPCRPTRVAGPARGDARAAGILRTARGGKPGDVRAVLEPDRADLVMITWDSEPEHRDDDTVWARSEGDVVEVGVSPQGRLRHVQIADDWRSHLKPSELAQNLVALAVGAHAQSVRENPPAGDQAPPAGT